MDLVFYIVILVVFFVLKLVIYCSLRIWRQQRLAQQIEAHHNEAGDRVPLYTAVDENGRVTQIRSVIVQPDGSTVLLISTSNDVSRPSSLPVYSEVTSCDQSSSSASNGTTGNFDTLKEDPPPSYDTVQKSQEASTVLANND